MIVGIFEGPVKSDNYHVQIIDGQNGRFGTIRINGVFCHRDQWGSNEQTLINACLAKVETWQTMCDRLGYGFKSVHGKIRENGDIDGRWIVQDMDR
jgi:hypothetical protein